MASLQGPSGAIEYTRDALGFPSVESRSLADSAWARGWFHAVDRLVQVQLALAIGRGEAMALLGDTVFARNAARMSHVHGFTVDLDAQVSALTPEVRAVVDAYCAGFAAGVRSRGWPLLLRAAGIKPAGYRPQDMILLYRVISWFGLTQLAEMPPLLTGELAAGGASKEALALLLGDAATDDELAGAPTVTWPDGLASIAGSPRGGSNAVAVAAARSASGGALLAGDPHMEIARIPPVLYARHTGLGGGDALTGLGIPGLAWLSFGRTTHVGWAYTYGHGAAVDVRGVRCRKGEMHDGEAWRPLTRRTATVPVRKRPAETWTFWDCALGTIVGDVEAATEVSLPCVRWSGLRETHRDFESVIALVRARDVDAAVEAHRLMSTLSLEAVLADSSGRIARVHTGRVDRRPATSRGVIPRAPDGPPIACDEATRPLAIDPPAGWIVSANARPVEPSGAAWVPMPEPHARIDRLTALMAATQGPLELRDLTSVILDHCDAGAQRLLPIWAPLLPDHPKAKALVAWAAQQPGHGDAHFESLTLWVALHGAVSRALYEAALGEARTRRLLDDLVADLVFHYQVEGALALERPAQLAADKLRGLLAAAFPRALEQASSPQHRLPRRDRFKNFLFAGKLSWLGFDSKPVVNPGGPTTPRQITAVSVAGQEFVFGGAGRFLCDMSKPGGWYCNSGGASERRFGPGYGKGVDAWARGTFVPMGGANGPAPSLDAK